MFETKLKIRMRIFTRYLFFTLIALLGWGNFAEAQKTLTPNNSSNPKSLQIGAKPDVSNRLSYDPVTNKFNIPNQQVNSKALLDWAKANKGKVTNPHSWIPQSNVVFKTNVGQVRGQDGKPQPQIKYEASSKGMQLYFTDKGVHYVFVKSNLKTNIDKSKLEFKVDQAQDLNQKNESELTDDLIDAYRVDLNFVGSNPNTTVLGEKESEMYFNYYLGQTVRAEKVKGYKMLVYRNIYDKIDLVFYGKEGGLKYDFVVHPGGDVSKIKMQYEGAQKLEITPQGGLRMVTPLGEINEDKPFSFQRINAQTKEEVAKQAGSSDVATNLIVNGNTVSFNIPNHDPSRLLVIDPTIAWSQFYGGATLDIASGVDVDRSGNVYVCGMTSSVAFPTFSGTQVALRGQFDAFLIKTDATGLVNPNGWATYYGSLAPNNGQDAAAGVAVDNAGNTYMVGITNGNDLVTQNPAQAANGGGLDLFVVSYRTDGAIRWATYYGGTLSEGIGTVYTLANVGIWGFMTAGIAVDSNNEPVIVSGTNSLNLPQTNKGFQRTMAGLTDIIVVKYTTDGQYRWASYFGGTEREVAYAISHDAQNNIYFTGATGSTNFPVSNAFKATRDATTFDACLVKFDPNGKRLWATYYGGGANDNIDWMLSGGVACDSKGDVIITGHTRSTNLIATPGAFLTVAPASFNGFVSIQWTRWTQ